MELEEIRDFMNANGISMEIPDETLGEPEEEIPINVGWKNGILDDRNSICYTSNS